MNNSQFWIAVCVPSFLVMLGIWRNDKRFDAVDSRLLVIEADLRRFYQTLGQHDEAIEILKKKANL
jgi:hypothetical protein